MKAATRKALKQIAASRAGCVVIRRAQSTGVCVGLYRSAEAGIETDPELPWSTVCEDHGNVVCHRTRQDAAGWIAHPEGWCDDCREIYRSKG